MLKTLTMAAFGLLLGTIGIDEMSGYLRFQYGIIELGDGIGVVPVAVGLFGLVRDPADGRQRRARRKSSARAVASCFPQREELRESVVPIARGTVLGFLIGIIPGSAHIISSFVSYGIERRISRSIPEEFGNGAIEGVAGPGIRQQCGREPARSCRCWRSASRRGRSRR